MSIINNYLQYYNTGCIYALKNPVDNKVFYIGQTTRKLKERLKEHIMCNVNKDKRDIIDSILMNDKLPIIEAIVKIETIEINNYLDLFEMYTIQQFSKKTKLTNKAFAPRDYQLIFKNIVDKLAYKYNSDKKYIPNDIQCGIICCDVIDVIAVDEFEKINTVFINNTCNIINNYIKLNS